MIDFCFCTKPTNNEIETFWKHGSNTIRLSLIKRKYKNVILHISNIPTMKTGASNLDNFHHTLDHPNLLNIVNIYPSSARFSFYFFVYMVFLAFACHHLANTIVYHMSYRNRNWLLNKLLFSVAAQLFSMSKHFLTLFGKHSIINSRKKEREWMEWGLSCVLGFG